MCYKLYVFLDLEVISPWWLGPHKWRKKTEEQFHVARLMIKKPKKEEDHRKYTLKAFQPCAPVLKCAATVFCGFG